MQQYDIYLINIDSSVSKEIRKTRTGIILSPDEMNESIKTVLIAPLTLKSPPYPTRVPVTFQGKSGFIVLDQIRTIDKARLVKKMGRIGTSAAGRVKTIISEMLVE